jgi:hypothetical protein
VLVRVLIHTVRSFRFRQCRSILLDPKDEDENEVDLESQPTGNPEG